LFLRKSNYGGRVVDPQKTGETVPNRGRIGTAMAAKEANLADWKFKGSVSFARLMVLWW